MPEPLLTVAECAAEARVSRMTVYRLVHEGSVPAQRIGRSYRVPTSAWRAYMDAQPTQTVTITRPRVAHTPEGVDPDAATAAHLREAARRFADRRLMGSSVTETVTKVLREVAEQMMEETNAGTTRD